MNPQITKCKLVIIIHTQWVLDLPLLVWTNVKLNIGQSHINEGWARPRSRTATHSAWKVFVYGVFLSLLSCIWTVSLHIQSECKKIQTRKTPNTDIFYSMPFCTKTSLCFNTFCKDVLGTQSQVWDGAFWENN